MAGRMTRKRKSRLEFALPAPERDKDPITVGTQRPTASLCSALFWVVLKNERGPHLLSVCFVLHPCLAVWFLEFVWSLFVCFFFFNDL